MDTELSQSEADGLLGMNKFCVNDQLHIFPVHGGAISVGLRSEDDRESFLLDIYCKRIALKIKYQTRARANVVLVRLDFGSPHRNPDGKEVGVPHLHLYREGSGDKWAIDVPPNMLQNPGDDMQVLKDFMSYCQIVQPPNIQEQSNVQLNLFS